ncbi:MAG TPA: hypothetical protein VE978_19140 [Chitinophagales bacterium]|nr:hypothetical protein [Chitinophagales bacterium]
MKALIEIKDSKAEFVMELLNNFSFVKVKPISDSKAQVLEELKEAVINLKLVKQGRLKAQPARELLDEL